MKNLLVLGSTGSIGTQTLDLVRINPDQLSVRGLSAHSNISLLKKQIEEFKPEFVAISDSQAALALSKEYAGRLIVITGDNCLAELVATCLTDVVVVGISGFAALLPVVESLRLGRNVALANKESLVTGGQLIRSLVKKFGGKIVPLDSEHSSLYQLLVGKNLAEVVKVTLTASGGPFLKRPLDTFHLITPTEAVKHPRWNMGAKISVDSATLMNKGLEVIEAAEIFDLPPSKIDVLVHPEHVIHALIEERSGAITSSAYSADMRLPIAYAIEEFASIKIQNNVEKLSFAKWGALNFEIADPVRFPALELAYQALRVGKSAPTVLNGANEVAVGKFLMGEIKFTDIVRVVDRVMVKHQAIVLDSLEQIYEMDAESRRLAGEVIKEIA